MAQDGSGDFVSVQPALDRARVDDTVLVRPGIYPELVTIDKDITIAGEGDRAQFVIEAVRPNSFRLPGAFDFTPVAVRLEVAATEALYRRLDFEVRDRWEIGPAAPVARTMWREPSSAKADLS